MSIKKIIWGLVMGTFVGLFLGFQSTPSIIGLAIYCLGGAIVFGIIFGLFSLFAKKNNAPKVAGFTKKTYLINVFSFLILSVFTFVITEGNNTLMQYITVSVTVLFSLLYLVGFIRNKFTSFIRHSFVSNYIYLFFVFLTLWVTNVGNINANEGYILISFALVFFIALNSLILIVIGLFQKPPIQSVTTEYLLNK